MAGKKSSRKEAEDSGQDVIDFLDWYLPLGPDTEMGDEFDEEGKPLKKKKKRKRKAGGKIMVGYKAGGKV